MTTITIDRAVVELLLTGNGMTDFTDAIDAFREALNSPQPEPEPVAWTHDKTIGLSIPLYTHPPRREWVSLTEDEIDALAITRLGTAGSAFRGFSRVIEAALKERNHE